MSVLKQYHQALEDESKRLKEQRIGFDRRENIRIDMRDLDDHNRRCRHIIRFFNIDNVLFEEPVDVVVDVDHWGDEE